MIETLGKALLFDIDGTLANTDPLHLKAFNQVLGPHGHVFDHARFSRELQGFANVSIGERFLPDETLERRAAILGEKEEVFRTLVAGQVEPLPGLMALLDRADDAGIPTIGIRTSLSDADLVGAGAVASASAFDDPALLARLAATMAW